jgi:hypothetical protein
MNQTRGQRRADLRGFGGRAAQLRLAKPTIASIGVLRRTHQHGLIDGVAATDETERNGREPLTPARRPGRFAPRLRRMVDANDAE